MKTFKPITLFSSLDLSALTADECATHKGLVADHVVAATAFTIEERDIRTKELTDNPVRFAVMILLDKASVQDEYMHMDITSELLTHIYNRFHELMCSTFGEKKVNLSLLERLLERFGAEVVDEDDDNITLGPKEHLN